jgi:hypothetical protein
MHDSYPPQLDAASGVPGSQANRAHGESWAQPSSSRMLSTYLADVEQNLDEQRWELALRDVADLPKIAVALADPELRSSPDRCRAWCDQWVRPTDASEESGVDHEHICRVLNEKAADQPSKATVPSKELRRLRLRRHARSAPRGFSGSRASGAGEDVTEAFAVCTAVVEGVRRWYAHFACHDATAQGNLARLAVLR